MRKSDIRKKILILRKKRYNKNLLISFDKFFRFLKIKNIKSKNIGGYYPFNFELDILNILDSLEKKNYQISLPRVKKIMLWTFFTGQIMTLLK